MVLTVAVVCLLAGSSCKNESAGHSAAVDAEKDYFSDYTSPENKWGFIDTFGRVVIPAQYDQVSAFQEGLAPVNFEGRWGYIDHRDTPVIPFKFRAAWQFRGGKARVLNFDGSPCFIDHSGHTVCPDHTLELYDFSDGLAVCGQGGLFGYIDTTGKTVIPPRYIEAWPFDKGVARVALQDGQGLIDRSGAFLLKPEYQHVSLPANGRILVQQENRYFYLDLQGDHMGGRYLHGTPYSDGVAAVADTLGWYLMDLHEHPLIEARYDQIRPAGEAHWIARNGTYQALLDHQGHILTPFRYDQINTFSENYAGYLKGHLWGFLDTAGNEITPPQFGLVWDFHEGMARAAFKDGTAYINTKGMVPFRPGYTEIRDFSEGLAPFQE